jgi:anti-sigma factor RsiW
MRRSRLESLLHDYVNGDLGDAERRDVECRLESDPKARALCEEVRAAQNALRLLRERPEPPVAARDVLPGIRAAIAAAAFEPRPRLVLEGMGTRYYRRIAIAATVLFALTVGYLSLRGQGATTRTAPPPAPSATVVKGAVELGSRREGITAAEFFRLVGNARDPEELQGAVIEPVVNVVDVAAKHPAERK